MKHALETFFKHFIMQSASYVCPDDKKEGKRIYYYNIHATNIYNAGNVIHL